MLPFFDFAFVDDEEGIVKCGSGGMVESDEREDLEDLLPVE
jgi:hypothetical protein